MPEHKDSIFPPLGRLYANSYQSLTEPDTVACNSDKLGRPFGENMVSLLSVTISVINELSPSTVLSSEFREI